MADAATSTRRAGRPRSSAHDGAILAAALHLLSRDGYPGMTLDGVAAEAGVSKATIYLRWRSKADLATAALAHLRETERLELTGELRADLVRVLRALRRNAERVGVMGLVGTCLAEEGRTPELLRLIRERTLIPRRRLIESLLRDAQGRGEVAEEANLDAVLDLLMGAYQSRYLTGEPFPRRWEEGVVDAPLGGLRPR